MENIDVIFLVWKKDVSTPKQITLELCENVYGRYHMVNHKFIVIEIIQWEEKERLGLRLYTRTI